MEVLKACAQVPTISYEACDGFGYMFVCWFGVNIIVELV